MGTMQIKLNDIMSNFEVLKILNTETVPCPSICKKKDYFVEKETISYITKNSPCDFDSLKISQLKRIFLNAGFDYKAVIQVMNVVPKTIVELIVLLQRSGNRVDASMMTYLLDKI